MAYKPKRKQIQETIEQIFFEQGVNEINRPQLNLMLLRKYGATKNNIDQILEMYAEANVLIVNHETITKA